MSISIPAHEAGGKVNVFWWVCTRNPFYAISAALVLLGLWSSFGNESEELENWLLMGGLAAYTLLLSLTAMVLVRYLKLWDDARTVMLLVVLMFLATSVTFDQLLVIDQERGTLFFLLGLALSMTVSELLLRGIKLRLPALYRVPYHLFLMLFFLYPIFVRSLLDPNDPMQEPVMWGLFGFSTAAAIVFLTLLPAVRRGGEYVRANGSPWPWPLYPWSLFVVLAIAVPGRAVLMCWSLHSLAANRFDRIVFAPYFLVPFGFALTVMFLELGLALGRRTMVRIGLGLPVLLVGLALVGNNPADPIYRLLRVMTVSIGDLRAFDKVSPVPDEVHGKFLKAYTETLGADPLFVTLVLAACFYGYAAARRAPLALEALAAVLASMSLIGTTSWAQGRLLVPAEPGPLLAPAAILLFLGARQRNQWHVLRGAACLAAAAALAMPLPESPIPGSREAVFVHLCVLAMLILGALVMDETAPSMRRTGAAFLLLFALAAMQPWFVPEGIQPALPILYPLFVGILLCLYGHFLRDSWIMAMAAIVLGCWLLKFGWTAYRAIRGAIRGFDYLVSGLGFFMVAVLVSLGKSGHLLRWIESRWSLPVWLRPKLLPALAVPPGDVAQPKHGGSGDDS